MYTGILSKYVEEIKSYTLYKIAFFHNILGVVMVAYMIWNISKQELHNLYIVVLV
jgi:hypothetical protein